MNRVTTKLIFALIIMLLPSKLNAQSKWIPTFQLPLEGATAANFNYNNLSAYLSRVVPDKPGRNTCVSELSLFYFKVNYKGEVDSLYVQGNLNELASNRIKNSILSTSKKWIIPVGSTTNDACWFVYPFFDSGDTRKCPEAIQIASSQLFNLIHLYKLQHNIVDNLGRVIISPGITYYIYK